MTRRTTFTVLAVLAACFIAALLLMPRPQPPRVPPPAGTGTRMMNEPPAGRADSEAVQAVERHLGTTFAKCGREYRTSLTEWQGSGGMARAVPRSERYMDLQLVAQPAALIDIDSMNNVDWKGVVTMTARAWSTDASGGSGEWQSFSGRQLQVRRKGGQWQVTSPDGWFDDLRGKQARRPICRS
ncbi:MAG TPA: hypothetical protein VMN03_00130 [Burkholderiales bacterium]|nr:hypothetical protein [Burkholderiales bacterium]